MRQLVAAGSLVLCLASAAGAQESPRADLFAGYSLVHTSDASLHGAEAALAYHFSGLLAAVLDLDWHTHTVEGVDHTTSAVLGGLRATFGRGSARPFVHALAGAVRAEDSIGVFEQTISESHTGFGGAAGGGLDVGGSKLAVRAQADYRLAPQAQPDGSTKTHGDPRFSVGVVFRFGTR
jgi:outer membrane protein with beta-barrel domain